MAVGIAASWIVNANRSEPSEQWEEVRVDRPDRVPG
jgi:hypothetical protein